MKVLRPCSPILLVLVVAFTSCSKKDSPVRLQEDAALPPPAKDEPTLYHAAVDDSADGGKGKPLVMTLDEVERHDRYSIIKVKYASGGSVASSMFAMKGIYDIAKQRAATYFIVLKEWDDAQGNTFYTVGFCRDKTVDPRTYFGADVDSSKQLEFLSVRGLDMLWGPGEPQVPWRP